MVIDEVQRAPGLFDVLRVLADRRDNPARFLILGSASPELLRQSSETLAGRIGYIELAPFSVSEVGADQTDRLWLTGGYPPSFLAKTDRVAAAWRKAYITTFLERDIPALGFSIPSPAMRRFWMMLAHYHGQTVNYSELGRSFGASDNTMRNYLEILESTFMIRQLPPWHENISKRQVKSPKMYIRDSGIFHSLIGVEDKEALMFHPKLGPSWEGFAIESVIRLHGAGPGECYFWSTHGGAELDLLLFNRGKRIGYEIKHTDSPRITRSMRITQKDLEMDDMYVVYPGSEVFPLGDRVQAVGLATLMTA